MKKGEAEKLEGHNVTLKLKDEYGGGSVEGTFSEVRKGEIEEIGLKVNADHQEPDIWVDETTVEEIQVEEEEVKA